MLSLAQQQVVAGTQVRLLGPVDISQGDTEHPVPGIRRKAVLAALALSAGQTLSAERLIEIVWAGDAPATAANTLQSHISHLRGLFGTRDAIVAAAPGYRLELAADPTDLRTAERLITQAKEADKPRTAAPLLQAALALWRARPLADLDGIDWFDAQADGIERLRVSAFKSLTDTRLALGEHTALVPELADLVARHPFDEDLHAQLMLALYRSGRQADAFEVYQQVRVRLGDELGVDPGRSLRDLETAMLRQDPSLEPPAEPIVLTPVPAQLPPALPSFVGRQAELDRLDETLELSRSGTSVPISVAVSAISGPPGVGKTSLAVQWAHRAAPEFPDGQLYVNLRGFDQRAAIMDTADVLHGFLEAFGVAPQQIPAGVEARVSLYRSVLAGRRVLVLLDNARDAEHARPLLPSSPGCVALVTSRNKLTPLVATGGAQAMPVDLFSRAAAHDLLAQRLSPVRIANEPDAVDDIISRCGGLPLALAIVAARAATDPAVSLAALAGEMVATTGALDTLSGGGDCADVRAVISWSYAVLSPEAARLFRHLALHPGADIGLPAVASLAAMPVPAVKRLLAELTGASLLVTLGGNRYSFHDLVRAYALELSERHDTELERTAVFERVLEHYLYTGYTATMLLTASRVPLAETGPARCGVNPENLAGYDEAMSWLGAEFQVLLALVQRAYAEGADSYARQLSWTMAIGYFAATAVESGRAGEAAALNAIGWYLARLGDHDSAAAAYRRAAGIYRDHGNRSKEAGSLDRLGEVYRDLGNRQAARSAWQSALEALDLVM